MSDEPLGGQPESRGAVAAFLNNAIDEIIDRASLAPEVILAEYESRGILDPEGRPFARLEDVRKHVTSEQAKRLSKKYVNLYAAMAAGQGFVTGLGGLITLPVTVPADAAAYVAWLARSASATQLAHGRETRTQTGDGQLKLAMLAGAGISHITVNGTRVLVAQLARRVVNTPYSRAPFQAAVKALAAKAGVQLTHKSFAKAVPVLGGAINGSAQAAMVKTAGGRMIAHYQDLVASGVEW